jgi:transcriptional regulator with XRE-family HTH domain
MTEFSENLKLCRMCLGVTQREMALKINKAKSTYRHYEDAFSEPSQAVMLKLCGIFNVTPNDLFGVIK